MDIYKVVDKDGSGEHGTIEYDPETKMVTVNLKSGPKLSSQLKEFFNSEREFWIPESQEIDDYRIEDAKPVDDPDHFRMAMSELYGATGVYVLWGE